MSKLCPSRGTALLWVAVTALLAGIVAYPVQAAALQQRATVTGTVTDAASKQPLAGVAVGVVGTDVATVTDAAGKYTVQAPSNGRLAFSRIGYTAVQVAINGRSTVDVALTMAVTTLDELVVTGYQTQRRGDITAAVSSVNLEAAEKQTSASVLQRLSGRVAGVTVEAGAAPGSRSTVRIRGISSFQNNDPLYIIDGVPVEDSYGNFVNPHDVESIQVLKDASAASIYGSRANNGVIIITTKKGSRAATGPQVSLDVNYGIANAARGYDDFLILNPLDYFEIEKRRYLNAGLPIPTSVTAIYGDPNNPSIPKYIYAHPSTVTGYDQWGRPIVDESKYSYPNALIMPGSAGTNWWDEVFGQGENRDINLAVRGGGERERYSVGFNFFDQLGTAIGNRYQRGTVRINTDFTSGRLTVGENLTIAAEEEYGASGLRSDNAGEGGLIGKNILSQPVIPVRDIQGNFASGKSPGLGNNSNPVKSALLGPDQRSRNTRIFGNVFARLGITGALSANTSLGINAGEGSYNSYSPIWPENSEPTMVSNIWQGNWNFNTWTLTNTLNFDKSFGGRHNVTLLAGQEAIRSRSRSINGSMAGLVSDNVNARYIQAALGNPDTRSVSSGGGISALLSWFGKADYNFDNKYYLSGTLRYDGSSRLGELYRWGTFPAFSAGWRVTEEPFLSGNDVLTNMMLRFGWGVTGNQNIPAGRTFSGFGGGPGWMSSFYAISGSDTRLATGYRQTSIGNPELKWEENQSTNIGMDAEFFGMATLELDVYERNSDNLLFNPEIPAAAGAAAAPIVNIGQMRNRGVDGSLGIRGDIGEVAWNLNVNASHYRNEIVRIDGNQEQFSGPVGTRTGSIVMNRVGHPIGAFYGYKTQGFYQSQAEIDQLNAAAKQKSGRSDAQYFAGAKPGRIRFADVNGDGVVNAMDRDIIGSPHPDFTGGVNLGLNWRSFDFAADVFGTFGNEIYDAQKQFYVFRYFPSNVRRDLLTDSWTPGADNSKAKYPILDATDNISSIASDFYLEDGSYVRLRSLQIGYTLPSVRGFSNARVFVRGENLFTITGYDGLDPSLPALARGGSAGDIRDQSRGIDMGVYPTSRVISVGFGVGF